MSPPSTTFVRGDSDLTTTVGEVLEDEEERDRTFRVPVPTGTETARPWCLPPRLDVDAEKPLPSSPSESETSKLTCRFRPEGEFSWEEVPDAAL